MDRIEAQAKVNELSRIRFVLYSTLPDISYALSFVRIIPQSSFSGSIKVIRSNILVGEAFWDYDLRTKLGAIVHGFFHISLRHTSRVKRLGIRYYEVGNIASDLVVNNIIDRIVNTDGAALSLPKDTIHYMDLIEEKDLIHKSFNNWSLEETISYLFDHYVDENETLQTITLSSDSDSGLTEETSRGGWQGDNEEEIDNEDNAEEYKADSSDNSDEEDNSDSSLQTEERIQGQDKGEVVEDGSEKEFNSDSKRSKLPKNYALGEDLLDEIKGVTSFSENESDEFNEELDEEIWLDRLRKGSIIAKDPGNSSLDLPYYINELREEVRGKKSNKYLSVLRKYLVNSLFNSPYQDWARLSRRSLSNKGKGFVTPGLRKDEKIKHVTLAVDRSGSTEEEIPFILKEVDSIRLSISCDITFIVFDHEIKEETFIPFDDSKTLIDLLEERDIQMKGGGGTSFIPIQRRMLELGSQINIIITDLYGTYLPEEEWDKGKLLIWVKPEDSSECYYGLSIDI